MPPEFESWFAGSKIVDSDGKPLRVYHGTTAQFDEFDLKAVGSNTAADNSELGFFFIADQHEAAAFASKHGDASGKVRVIEAYISIKKPLLLATTSIFTCAEQAPTLYEIFSGERLEPAEALEAIDENIGLGEIGEIAEALGTEEAKAIMIRDGYDGVISHFGGGHDEYVVFSPSQIQIIESREVPRLVAA